MISISLSVFGGKGFVLDSKFYKEDLNMPSESVLAQKQQFVADLAEKQQAAFW